jgi:hypothetical protein
MVWWPSPSGIPYFMAQQLAPLHEEGDALCDDVDDESSTFARCAAEHAIMTADATSLAGATAQLAVYLALIQHSTPGDGQEHALVSALGVLVAEPGIDLSKILTTCDMTAIGKEAVELADKLRRQRAIA